MPIVDNLNIEISAQANRANASLNSLIRSLERVSASLSSVNGHGLATMGAGVSKLANSMNNFASNTKTADFSRLARNLSSVSSVDTSNFSAVAGGVSSMASAFNQMGAVSQNAVQIGEVAKNISKLGNKGVLQAIDNIPKLATAMKELMSTLSKAPTVSQNVIQMTNALANLARNGSKVGSSSRVLAGGLNIAGNSMRSTRQHTMSLAAAFGKLYANYWLVIRGAQSLWKSIKNSMNYVETLNYFNAAFGQVADSAVSRWKESGYESAEAYYNSFSDRAKQLTQKMTGYSITDSGMLQSGTGKSLGIEPSKLMNYQSVFAQMSNSIGITADTSVKLSQALTEIGGDLASVKNMDFDKVWKDMASGLAGMSRTLDKYGVNIRNVNLQQKLNELGINANIQALNQNEKALLRTIILLDSTRYAWGDLADTLNQPANQLRMLQSNFSNLARTIGNIFLPIVAKVLPYMNALVVALQKLAEFLVNLLGFEDFDWGGVSGGSSDAMSDLYDSIADTGGALDSATESAKNLRHQLQGFDELNVITTQDASSGGTSGAGGGINTGLLESALDKILEEYQATWDKAFDNMEVRYDSFANHVAEVFKTGGLEGVGSYLSSELANQLNKINWKKVYEGASGFGTGFASFLNGIFDNDADLLGSVGKTIASGLNTAIYTALAFGNKFDFKGFGQAIASGINNFFSTFDFVALARTLNTWVDGLEELIGSALKNLDWKTVLKGVADFLKNLEFDTAAVIIGVLTIKKIGKVSIIETAVNFVSAKLAAIFGGIALKDVALTFTSFLPLFQGTAGFDVIVDWIIRGIDDALEALLPKGIIEAIGNALAGISFGGIAGSWLPGIGTLAGAIAGALASAMPKALKENVFNFDWTTDWFNKAKEAFKNAFSSKSFGEIGYWILEGILDGFVGAFSFILEPIADFFSWTWEGICKVFGIASPAKQMKPLGKYILLGILEGFSGAFPEMTKQIKILWSEYIKPWFTTEKWKQNIGSIKKALSDKWDEAKIWWNKSRPDLSKVTVKFMDFKEKLKSAWSSAVKWWNENKPSLSEITAKIKIPRLKVTWDTEGFAAQALQKLGLKGYPNFSVSYFAAGGFPDKSSLFVAGENGIPEMLGTVGGRTAVAGGAEITGIRDAVYNTGQEEASLLRVAVSLLQVIAEKDYGISYQEVFKASQRGAKEYTTRTGKPAYT